MFLGKYQKECLVFFLYPSKYILIRFSVRLNNKGMGKVNIGLGKLLFVGKTTLA